MTNVYLELGKKKVFACALEWPGWARAGKTDELALAALDEYADRYKVVAGKGFQPGTFTVVQRIAGNTTTDFGAPDRPAASDLQPWTATEAARQVKLLQNIWQHFDEVAAKVTEQLRKGPRGGGRDRDDVIRHTLAAEASYARTIGLKPKEPTVGDTTAIAAMRADIANALCISPGGPPASGKGWPAQYALRRIAWHVLDHLWEMEDKSLDNG